MRRHRERQGQAGWGGNLNLSLVETILHPLSQPKIVSERLFYGVSTGQELARVVANHPGKGGWLLSQNKGGFKPSFFGGVVGVLRKRKSVTFR